MSSIFDNPLQFHNVKCLTSGLLELISVNNNLLNSHMVDFITEDHWSSVLDETLKRDIERLGLGENGPAEQAINTILFNNGEFTIDCYPSLNSFAKGVRDLELSSIANKLVSTEMEAEDQQIDAWWMKQKKSHEVQSFSELVSAVASHTQAKTVIDLGSGKGYLSTLLSLRHKLKVLGLDCSQSNTRNAQRRYKKVASVYDKAAKKKAQINEEEPDAPGEFLSLTESVNVDTNLQLLLCRWHQAEDDERLVLCGLHTCGDLGATILKQFLSSSNAEAVCYVGCCYHLIQEEFSEDPFPNQQNKDLGSPNWGFPLSRFLRSQNASLGRNSRMLASQSLHRLSDSGKLFQNEALLYRAALQVILRDLGKTPRMEERVGKITSKCQDFVHYFRTAVKRLKINDIMNSDEDIQRLYTKYQGFGSKLNIFQALRVLLAPAVEALVILDRIIFLMEEEMVKSCHLFQVFDPKISPRCYGIVAFKT